MCLFQVLIEKIKTKIFSSSKYDENVYQQFVKNYTIRSYYIFFFYICLALCAVFFKNLYFNNFFRMFIVVIIIFIMIKVLFILRSKESTFRKYPDLLFCIIVFLIYAIHLKFILPNFFTNLDGHYNFYIGSAFESLRIFLYISKIRWFYVFITNICLNILNLHFLLKTHEITENIIFIFLFSSIMTNSLPILSYFQDTTFRFLFFEHINDRKNIDSFENLFNLLPNQIVIFDDSKSKILYCNYETEKFNNTKNLEEILEYLKTDYTETSTKDNILKILENFSAEYLEENKYLNYEIITKKKNSLENNYFNAKIGKIHFRNQFGFIILLNDISAYKICEKLKENDSYKDRLLATVSHDLRTPLNSIMGILELIYDQVVEKEIKKNIKIALRSAKLLLFMINDFLDYSQINNGKLRLNFCKVEIVECVKEVISIMKFQCQKKGIKLITNIIKEEIYILTDPNRLKQILLNLLSNAFKFTTIGSIKLTIEILKTERLIRFFVEDTGIGIKKEEIPKLFQLFGKLDQKSNINQSGIGLGLVISKLLLTSLTQDQKSSINVKSNYGEGTMFYFDLPLVKEEEEINDELKLKENKIDQIMSKYKKNVLINDSNEGGSTSSSFKSPSLKNKKIKILIVDDDQINLFVLSKYLESFNISYKTANNGLNAIEILKQEKGFNLVFMDCNMPVMNGFQASLQINELQNKKEIEYFPIVALTGNTGIKEIEQCKQSKMTSYLSKPLSKKLFKETLEILLKRKID